MARVIEFATAVVALDAVAREAMMFAATGFLVGGIDDLIVDILYLARREWRGGHRLLADIGQGPHGPIAIFLPAWDESAVIAPMIGHALGRIDYPNFRLYVGAYHNDRATIAAAAAVAADDRRVRLVINECDGPTTKADCLNAIWRAYKRDEAAGEGARAIVLHDAEDIVHADELRVFDRLIAQYDVVQLPVRPLIDRRAPLVSGHYADEFAESHAKQLAVRTAIGAALPLAGVGCAISTKMLSAVAKARGGDPFDGESLTEDYELGLAIAAAGGRGLFARVRESPGGPMVSVQAYFPSTIEAAVKQKARWMTGIALTGWDRIGWGAQFSLSEYWMRMRDRRAPLAVLVLAAAYVALVAWGLSFAVHRLGGGVASGVSIPTWLLTANGALLGWRLVMRAAFTGAAYGMREALWSVPRALVANLIALLAARRAITRYVGLLRGARLVWDKTAHVFPQTVAGGVG